MEVILAKSRGFCFGVRRAVETVYEEIEKGEEIYTYGAIVNNEEVVGDLQKKGVKVIEGREEKSDFRNRCDTCPRRCKRCL